MEKSLPKIKPIKSRLHQGEIFILSINSEDITYKMEENICKVYIKHKINIYYTCETQPTLQQKFNNPNKK